jgi:FMN phosphatase YigB (HAD superfamily)
MNIKVISFDIGNTLIKLSSKGFCTEFSIKTGIELEKLRPLFHKYFLTKSYTLQFAVEKVCNIIDYKYPQKIIDGFYPSPVELFEDVLPTLKYLKNKGITTIALSNCCPWEATGIEELGLKAYIKKIF